MGPGVLVAAAFIGPGTITVCSMAGIQFGYSLLWALLLSIAATVILQEMAARLGIVTQKGLANIIKEEIVTPWMKILIIRIPRCSASEVLEESLKTDSFHKMIKLSSVEYLDGSASRIIYS